MVAMHGSCGACGECDVGWFGAEMTGARKCHDFFGWAIDGGDW